jgi:N-succinyldiaminopimelate aminotransferase
VTSTATSAATPPGRWADVARAAGLLSPDGTPRATIFARMSALAKQSGSINLGQGYPDADGPHEILERAVAAIRSGGNQYAPGPGIAALRRAIADHQGRHYGIDVDPDTEVLVTTGATEAIAAAVLALTEPGDEVVTLEPFYDSYAAVIALAGAVRRTIRLRRPDATTPRWHLDSADVRAAVGPRTRLILLNTPHNPTGAVLTRAELDVVAAAAREHNALVVTDEVYEHLVYDGAMHIPIATLPDMAGRTLTISSAGKTFSVTGWKIGWVCGPAALVDAVRAVKQFLTYTSGGPFQPAIAHALSLDGAIADLRASLETRRDALCAGLRGAGFDVSLPEGTYFAIADAGPLGFVDGASFCDALPGRAGVVAIPVSALTTAPEVDPLGNDPFAALVRFAFCRSAADIATASARLAAARWA